MRAGTHTHTPKSRERVSGERSLASDSRDGLFYSLLRKKKRILVIFIALLLLAITVIVIIAIIPLSSLLEKIVIPLSLFWFA